MITFRSGAQWTTVGTYSTLCVHVHPIHWAPAPPRQNLENSVAPAEEPVDNVNIIIPCLARIDQSLMEADPFSGVGISRGHNFNLWTLL